MIPPDTCRPWPTTMSFIYIGHPFSFPELYTLNLLIFARVKFRDSRIFLKTDFSRVLNFANRHI